MELKVYLNILFKKWWIVIPAFLITFTSGVVFTYTQTPIYRATATYVVAPGSSFEDDRSFLSGLNTLSQRAEIASTFAEIASSRSIKNTAIKSISLESGIGYSINSELRRGTNIIEISATGPNPAAVRDLANAVGTKIEEYVQGLFDIYALIPLDEATTPTKPISPKTTNNLVLSAIFGLILGGSLAFLAEYLEAPLRKSVSMNILDDETGLYNKEYFSGRLSQEMVRAKRNRYPLSLALMRVGNLSMLKGSNSIKVRAEILRQVGMLTGQYLREEDIVAYLENDVFALLLPDVTGENAKTIIEYLQTRVAWTPFETSAGTTFNLKGIVGITSYDHNGSSRDELMARANRALQLAEVEGDGKAFLIITPSHNDSGDGHD